MESMQTARPTTPWRRAFAHLGLPQAALTKELGFKNRSTISRALQDDEGLITPRSQKKLLALGKKIGREINPADLLPDV